MMMPQPLLKEIMVFCQGLSGKPARLACFITRLEISMLVGLWFTRPPPFVLRMFLIATALLKILTRLGWRFVKIRLPTAVKTRIMRCVTPLEQSTAMCLVRAKLPVKLV